MSHFLEIFLGKVVTEKKYSFKMRQFISKQTNVTNSSVHIFGTTVKSVI
jgi:hypothetical protein